MKACPNIDQVHFRFYRESLPREEMEIVFTSIRFNQLTWLTIDLRNLLFAESNLVAVMYHLKKIF